MEMVENITSSIDSGQYTAGVFIDLKKAFDTIDHTIPITKLKHYGIKGVTLLWIESYFSNRNQYIYYNAVESDKIFWKDRKDVENLLSSELCNLNKWFEVIKLT